MDASLRQTAWGAAGASDLYRCCIMDTTPTTMLHDSVSMPMHGLGVFKTKDGDEVRNAVTWAIEDGYRLIDTATVYENERGVGEAIAASGVPRSEIFVTTKVWNSEQGYEATLAAMSASLDRLAMEYVDLYLIHWPVPEKTAETWRALEHLVEEGLTRAIGVSNFEPHHLDQLMADATTPPSVNQVELHPTLQQKDVREANAAIGCLTQAWSPLKRGQILTDPTIQAIATSLDVTPAQVVIRWDLQSGIATIPKSVRRHRIRENADVFGFSLDDEQMAAVEGLDSGDRTGPHPDHIDF
ncbi:MAG: aldo/keto reductase [Acidimicrobiia bacterium]|nr:MAG: aldo/keto reductase [Acidimicrobiia bacterium]